MNPSNKVTLERWAALVASGIFLLTSSRALQQTGWFSRHEPVKPSQVSSLAEAMQGHWKEIEALTSSQEVTRFALALPTSVGYAAQNLRDPFQSLLPSEAPPKEQVVTPPAPPVSPPPTLDVGGVSFGAKPMAVINGRVTRIGDVVAGVKILSIERSGITVDYHGSSLIYPTSGRVSGIEKSVSPWGR